MPDIKQSKWEEQFKTLIEKETDFLHTNGDSCMLDENTQDLEKIKQFISDLLRERDTEISILKYKIIQRDKEWLSKIDKAIEQCHGGGNGRRLLIQLKGLIK